MVDSLVSLLWLRTQLCDVGQGDWKRKEKTHSQLMYL